MREVVVIGGGVTGSAVARACALAGLDVVLVDRDDIGAGASDLRAELAAPVAEDLANAPIDDDADALAELRAVARGSVWSTPLEGDGREAWLVDSARLSIALAVDGLRAGAELVSGREVVRISRAGEGLDVSFRDGAPAISARAVVVAAGADSPSLAPDGPTEIPTVTEVRVRFDRAPDERARIVRDAVGELALLPGAKTLDATLRAHGDARAADVRDRAIALVPELAAAEVVAASVCTRLATELVSDARGGRVLVAAGLAPARAVVRAQRIARAIADELGPPPATTSARVARRQASVGDLYVVCPCSGVTEREVRRAIRDERARDLRGVRRRTALGEGACAGVGCAVRAAEILATMRGVPPDEARASAVALVDDVLAARERAGGRASWARSSAWRAELAALGVASTPSGAERS